jgi:hypothetical protein
MDILRRNPPDASFGSGNNNPQGACTTPCARRPLDHRGTDTVVILLARRRANSILTPQRILSSAAQRAGPHEVEADAV